MEFHWLLLTFMDFKGFLWVLKKPLGGLYESLPASIDFYGLHFFFCLPWASTGLKGLP